MDILFEKIRNIIYFFNRFISMARERTTTPIQRMTTSTEQPIFTSTIIVPRTRTVLPSTKQARNQTGFPKWVELMMAIEGTGHSFPPFIFNSFSINISPWASTTTVKPLHNFELLIVGNRTRPFFDRRLGKITERTEDLLCDFANNFACLWGPEAGRWAIVEEGKLPEEEQKWAIYYSFPFRCNSLIG
jgi:hypothetical protein